jgi:carbonic anhydrase
MRRFLTILSLAGMLALGLHADEGTASPGVAPEEAWRMLDSGNDRFARGLVLRPHVDAERQRELSHRQRPWAVVVAGSDSRVVPEIIFDQGLGDLYVLRNGGSIIKSEVEVGSIEYAVKRLGVRLVVVLGNSKSGEVRAAVEGVAKSDKDSLGQLAGDMQAPVAEASDKVGGLSGEALVAEAVEKNVLYQMKELLKLSPLIAARVESGDVKVVGGVYHLENSRVDWLGEHPSQKAIVEGKKP